MVQFFPSMVRITWSCWFEYFTFHATFVFGVVLGQHAKLKFLVSSKAPAEDKEGEIHTLIVTALCCYVQPNIYYVYYLEYSAMLLWNLQPLPCCLLGTCISWSNFQCNVNTAVIINTMDLIVHYLYLYMLLRIGLFSLRFS